MNQFVTFSMFSLLCYANTLLFAELPDMISRITITSAKATCREVAKHHLQFTYHDNVRITFADGTTITTKQLITDLSTEQMHKPSMDSVQKITLEGNVLLTQNNRSVRAQRAIIEPSRKTCTLSGNVEFEQHKASAYDIPLITRGETAILNLQSKEITLRGGADTPVSTTITVTGYPKLMKKVKTKAEKRAERAARKQSSTKRA